MPSFNPHPLLATGQPGAPAPAVTGKSLYDEGQLVKTTRMLFRADEAGHMPAGTVGIVRKVIPRSDGHYSFVVQWSGRMCRMDYYGPETLWKITECVIHSSEWRGWRDELARLSSDVDEQTWPLYVPAGDWELFDEELQLASMPVKEPRY